MTPAQDVRVRIPRREARADTRGYPPAAELPRAGWQPLAYGGRARTIADTGE